MLGQIPLPTDGIRLRVSETRLCLFNSSSGGHILSAWNDTTTSQPVFIAGYLPDELVQEFMQYVRNFDVSHPGCHLQIMLSSEASTEEIEKMLDSVDPKFKIRRIVPFKF